MHRSQVKTGDSKTEKKSVSTQAQDLKAPEWKSSGKEPTICELTKLLLSDVLTPAHLQAGGPGRHSHIPSRVTALAQGTAQTYQHFAGSPCLSGVHLQEFVGKISVYERSTYFPPRFLAAG